MKRFKSLSILVVIGFILTTSQTVCFAQQTVDQCVACHANLEGVLHQPVEEIPDSVHGKWNLSCSDCHGGDPTKADATEAKGEGTTYRGKPSPTDIPQFCGRCHSDPDYMRKYNPTLPTDQEQKYYTSHHGKQLKEGNESVAQCISCHGAHSIYPKTNSLSSVYPLNIPQTCSTCHSDEKHMEASGLPTDQYEKYRASVHGKALFEKGDIAGAPACNDCHGNHGAAPPAISSVANVCGTCHVRNRELFAVSKHKQVFDDMEMPECSTCHGHHEIMPVRDDMLGTGEESLCLGCHDPDEPPMMIGNAMRRMIVSLESDRDHAQQVLQQAEQKGMLVDEGLFMLESVREKLIDSRTYIHTFHVASVSESIAGGRETAIKARHIGEQALKDYYFRRQWLGISTIIVTFVAIGLYLKIREIDKNRSRA